MSALVPYVAPELSPEAAEQRALVIRAKLDQRPDDAVIRAWLEYVAVAVSRPRPTDDEIVTLTGVLLDGEYPAAVFNATTRREAARRFKYWPSAAEVFELLAPHIAAMGIELPGLDRIVRNAKRAPIEPAREAFGYDPGPANSMPWQEGRTGSGAVLTTRRLANGKAADADAEEQKETDESARKQLADLAAMGIDITYQRPLPSPAVAPVPPVAVANDQPVSQPKRKRERRLEVVR